MTIRLLDVSPNLPLAEWSVFYIEGEPYIYDDSDLFLDEDGEHMGQHPRHSGLAIYLAELLRWLYRAELCTVTFDLFFKTEIELAATNLSAKKTRKAAARLSPDVSFIRGVRQPDKATYVVGEDGPSPDVVFEVGSESTYSEDLTNKFRLYAEAFGAKEYIAYDPHEERLWQGSRLKAWKLVDKTYVEMARDPRGWIWSEGLQHWLVEDGAFLRLYDAQGYRRLTAQEEAEQEKLHARQAESQVKQTRLQFRQERKKNRQAESQIRQEKRRADQAEVQIAHAQAQIAQERQRAAQAEARLEQLEEQLRKRDAETEIN